MFKIIKNKIINAYIVLDFYIKSFTLKLISFYMKYQLVILMTALILSAAFTLGCFIYLFLIKTIVMAQGAVVLAAIENIEFPNVEERQASFDALMYVKNTLIAYSEEPAAVIAYSCPNTGLKTWMLANCPENILHDNIGRNYYVVTEHVFETFIVPIAQENNMSLNEQEMDALLTKFLGEIAEEIDPTCYDAVHSSAEKAQEVIDINNKTMAKVQSLIEEETSNIEKYSGWITQACVIGFFITWYFSTELLAIAN